MNIFLLGIFAVLIYIFTTQLNDPKGLRISRTFGLSRISLTSGIVLLTLSLVILSIFFLLVIIYFKTENKVKRKNSITNFSLFPNCIINSFSKMNMRSICIYKICKLFLEKII
ncbi:hypothetical protein NW739_06420 [Mycoplasmopsis felis]|uniref:hypothetical protein n=1 Tax=Mycoplasmopsis felis TaxID=33923 RepID=UPI0021E0347C|nr:hypothetical protein [Mycoplasmopsis felis]MCU9940280.1 hypothetical protein [Mycoplasmopsis felis]